MNTEVVDCLVAARKRLEDPANWGKGAEVIISDNPKDCASYAVLRVHPRQTYNVENASLDLLARAIGSELIVEWNDAPERTHEEVLAAYDKAIELAKGAGNEQN